MLSLVVVIVAVAAAALVGLAWGRADQREAVVEALADLRGSA